jgi:hydroxymethylpyrimidine pyrophosphatase-like HAD family hydrolase
MCRSSEYIETLAAKYPTLGITRAIPFILEVHDPHTNKGTALSKICQHLNLSSKNALVFGDGENDIAMFREAGYSVAMANGMAVSGICSDKEGVPSVLIWETVVACEGSGYVSDGLK